MVECARNANSQCTTIEPPPPVGQPTIISYDCAASSPDLCVGTVKCCSTDNCNCPDGVHKTAQQVGDATGDMRKIMFPIMGLVFGLSWVALAFFINRIPHHVLTLTVISLIDVIFGIFLIFIPATAFLGLYFIALGAFSILVIRNGQPHQGMILIAVGSLLAFLVISGIVYVVSGGGNIIDQVQGSVQSCEGNLHLQNVDESYWNLNTRCENWVLFTVFSVFLLFLLQPITLMNTFYIMYKIERQAEYNKV